jgi:DNA/RNA-binding domain of Phe-tRNA-synthetase-like protein
MERRAAGGGDPGDGAVIGEPDLRRGYLQPDLAAEFPELALTYTVVEGSPQRSPEAVRERLRDASNRFTGGKAVQMRQQPIPWAYRVFFRHIGIDPDEQRTPIEQIAVDRMQAGGFRSNGLVADALLLATLETSVPVVAFDADEVAGEVGLRLAQAGEGLGPHEPLAPGQIVIADEERPLAVLFGAAAGTGAVKRRTRRVLLAAIQVAGVPAVSVEEALWTAAETLSTAQP